VRGTVQAVPSSHEILASVEAAYHEHFEVTPSRASITFVGVEPIEVLRYAAGEVDHYVTLGMSRHGMVDPATSVTDEAVAPRAELLLSVKGRPDQVWRRLALLAAGPAVEGAVYAAGNRVELGEPLVPGSRCTGGVLETGPLQPVKIAGISDVVVLRLLPAAATELAFARVHGSADLVARWRAAGVDLTDIARNTVDLS
jgi:suppressor of fused protein SUFU